MFNSGAQLAAVNSSDTFCQGPGATESLHILSIQTFSCGLETYVSAVMYASGGPHPANSSGVRPSARCFSIFSHVACSAASLSSAAHGMSLIHALRR